MKGLSTHIGRFIKQTGNSATAKLILNIQRLAGFGLDIGNLLFAGVYESDRLPQQQSGDNKNGQKQYAEKCYSEVQPF